jgi:hypothetical protein
MVVAYDFMYLLFGKSGLPVTDQALLQNSADKRHMGVISSGIIRLRIIDDTRSGPRRVDIRRSGSRKQRRHRAAGRA